MARTRKNLRNRRRSRKQWGGADCPKGMPPKQCDGWLRKQQEKAAREAKEAAETAAFNKNAPLSEEEIKRRIGTMLASKKHFEKLIETSNEMNRNNNTEENVHEFNETKNI